MNKYILEQLGKVKIKLPEYTSDTTSMLIKKNNGQYIVSDLNIGGKYHVYLENYIINEPANFTLSANWNRGTKPSENKGIIVVLLKTGNMLKVDFIGDTTGISWTGFLPRKSITILEDLN